jgi:hypothetical protein
MEDAVRGYKCDRLQGETREKLKQLESIEMKKK